MRPNKPLDRWSAFIIIVLCLLLIFFCEVSCIDVKAQSQNQFLRFYVSWSLLDRLPQTRLGRLRRSVFCANRYQGQSKIHHNPSLFLSPRCKTTEELLELCDKFNLDVRSILFHINTHPVFCRTMSFTLIGILAVLEQSSISSGLASFIWER